MANIEVYAFNSDEDRETKLNGRLVGTATSPSDFSKIVSANITYWLDYKQNGDWVEFENLDFR